MIPSKFALMAPIALIFLSSLSFAEGKKAICGQLLSPDHIISADKVERDLRENLQATLNSLESMRGENGLLADTIWVNTDNSGQKGISVLNPDTSPTNVAVDILIQAEIGSLEKVAQILNTLKQLEYHKASGLFFSRYSTDKLSKVMDPSVSSIDNLHLAIALWTVKENFPGTAFGTLAEDLFSRMNFQIFYSRESGLIGGNLKFKNDEWIKEEYNFSNFGSEARLIYSVGWALGLFPEDRHNVNFLEKALSALKIETIQSQQGRLLKLWDGSAFQLYFPKIFISEERYSERIQTFYQSHLNYIFAEGRRRGLPIAAGHSAGRISKEEYRDKSGNRLLVSSDNRDLSDPRLSEVWDNTVQPYAIIMALTTDPNRFADFFARTKNIKSGNDNLYSPTIGWMDGLNVEGPEKGQVVPAQILPNQGFIALSILQMLSVDGMGLSGRTLFKNQETKKRLQQFYDIFEQKLPL